MGWVVTRWRTDRLAALLDGEARESARRLLWEAERDAARVRSKAAGSAASAALELAAIERLGMDLRDGVRAFRAGEAPSAAPVALAAPAGPIRAARLDPRPFTAPPTARRHRRARASLRESPLAEMMRAGAAR